MGFVPERLDTSLASRLERGKRWRLTIPNVLDSEKIDQATAEEAIMSP